MALQTKTITANGAKGHHKFTLNVIEDSIDINNNKSILNFNFKLSPIKTGWDWSGWGSSISYSIAIGSNTYSGTIPSYDGSSTVELKSGSNISIPHENNGDKKISVSFTLTDGAGQSYTPGNASASGTMELTTIPRASDVAVANTDLGQNIPITIGKKVDAFTSTLSYTIGSLTGTIVEKTSLSNYPWVMTSSLISSIKKAYPSSGSYASGGISATITCKTYNGTTLIGTTTATFKLYITDKPTISNVVRTELNSKISALTTSVLRHASQNQFTITATAPTGATIASYRVKNGTQDSGLSTSNIVNLNDIQTYYTESSALKTKFVITCIDTRGNESEEYPLVCNFINYVQVSINKTDVVIKRTSGTSTDCKIYLTGNFFNGKIGSTSNAITLKCRYKLKESSTWGSWITLTTASTDNTFKANNVSISGTFDYKKNYDFEIIATDSIGESDSYSKVFANSVAIAKVHKNGVDFIGLSVQGYTVPYFTVEETWDE